MTAPIVALDTETTGLDPVLDDIWEFAGIRREPDGTETELHLFIEHDRRRCGQLPESFLRDHRDRYPGPGRAVSQWTAAMRISAFLRPGRPHVVGAVPSFDTSRLERLLRAHHGGGDWTPPWHYHLIDVENLVIGWLRARHPSIPLHPPWNSEALSNAAGVPVIPEERHTALGDARWALRLYDTVMGPV